MSVAPTALGPPRSNAGVGTSRYAGRVEAIFAVEDWIYRILFWGLLAIRAWAFIDCAIRKHAAFPAAGKLTKPAWLLITASSLALSFLLGIGQTIGLISLGLLVASLVYLTDVRPAVREVSGGSRW
jgi:hypothetical protein